MTAVTAAGANANDFVNDAYRAPTADLIEHSEDIPENKAFSTQGRMGVLSHMARILLASILMGISVAPFAGVMIMSEGAGATPNVALMVITGAIFAVGLIGCMAYMVCNSIKRLHDIDLSGWFLLVGMIPFVGILFNLYMSLKPGKDEPNRFAGATKPTSTKGKIAGSIMLVLYGLGVVFNLASMAGLVAV